VTTGPHAPTLDPPTRTPVARPLLAWTILIMLVLFIVVNWADKAILGLVATPVMKELGIGEAEFGFIGS
jgi:ACS family hexuronate transporter-like MFS transporter